MAIPVSIEKLLEDNIVEHARIEFKASWNPDAILRTLCAFANDIDNWGGGYIVVGIEEENGQPKKPIAGLSPNNLDKYQKELLNLCHKIQPLYIPVCSPVVYEGKHLLLIWAPGGYERPYMASVSQAQSATKTAYYIRRFSSTVKATKVDIKELHDVGGNIPFDDRINYNSKLTDVRLGRMLDYLNTVGSTLAQEDQTPKDLAIALRVVGGPPEAMKPLNVGLLFFNDKPADFLRESYIEVVSIFDPTGEGMTERTFSGPLDRQLSDALVYIKNFVVIELITKNPSRPEANRVFNYPYSAIEEALSNAVYHKSYQIPEPITVRIEDTRLTITSFPGPDRSITQEDLQKNRLVARRYRNRRIGDFLKELHLAEGRNTGVPTMLKSLSNNGSAPPLFTTDEERSFFSVEFEIHNAFTKKEIAPVSQPDKRRRTKGQMREEVLRILRSGAYSQREIATAMNYSGVPNTLTAVVRELMSEGLIEATGKHENSPKAKLSLSGVQRDTNGGMYGT